MTIAALIKAIPPPVLPAAPFEGPWEPLEYQLGTALPEDYKALVQRYGHGTFFDILHIHVPRSRVSHVRFETSIREICEPLREADELPYPLWPQAGGLLPVGRSEVGDTVFWIVDGPPSTWRIFLCDRDLMAMETLDCDLTGFLAGLATGHIQPKDFLNLMPEDVLFEPWGLRGQARPEAIEDWTQSGGYGQTTLRSLTLKAQLKPPKS